MTVRQGLHSTDSFMNRIQEYKMGRPKSQSEKKPPIDGVYKNTQMMHATASLVGSVVRVQLRDGTIHDGVFSTFSPEGDIVLETAHGVQPGTPVPPSGSGPLSLLGAVSPVAYKMVYRWKDIVSVLADAVDPNFATMGPSDAFTDTAISKFNGTVQEKELEPWDGGDSFNTNIEVDDGNANGWDPNDMFRTNAEKYGVKSSYDNSLQEYTVSLQPKDTEEWRAREARASRIAQEIEGSTGIQRNKLDDGLDEEDRFSAVVRTTEPGESGSHTTPRYVTPHKRRNNPSTGRRHNSGTIPAPAPLQKIPLNGEPVPEEPVKPSFLPLRIEKRIEPPKITKHKGRTDEIEEFRKFSSNFKLAEECREEKTPKEVESPKPPPPTEVSKSTLNPNAKAFTPRCQLLVPSPQPQQIPQQQQQQQQPPPQPQRLQQQNPLMVMPQVPPMFPTYMPPNATRFRKVPVSMAPPRPPDMGPPMHVAAATGQPILAPPGSVQYAPSAPPPPQQTIPYPQMNFMVGPRVVPPQQTSQHMSYVDTSHQHMSAHHHHLMMPPGYAAAGQPMGGQGPPTFPPQPLVLLPHQQVTLVPPPYMTQQTQGV